VLDTDSDEQESEEHDIVRAAVKPLRCAVRAVPRSQSDVRQLFGAVAMSVGIGCWSLDLLKSPGAKRVVGAWGCIVGILPPLALFSKWSHLDVHGMTQVIVLQATWYIAMALVLISPIRPSTPAPV
jgi:hypothetical protein